MEKKSTTRGPKADYSETKDGGKALAAAIGEMSQARAAAQLSVTPAFLNHLIHGRKTPGLALARAIRDRFKVSVDAW